MLTVIRELAEAAERADDSQPAAALLVELVHAGEESLARTQDMLDVLRDAGVVDAGGAGLLEIVRGLAATATGEPIPEAPAARVARVRRDPPGALGVPLLHDVRDRGRRSRARGARGRVREARRLAARRRRPDGDEGARAHRRARQGARDRHDARHDRGRRDREHARADAAPLGAAARGRSGRGADRRRRGRRRRGEPPALRDARRDELRRGRADDEPVHRRPRRRDRAHRRRRRSSCSRTTRT